MQPNPQIVVSLIGPDGAGKSTLAKELAIELGQRGLNVETQHTHQWWRNIFLMPLMLFSSRRAQQVVILDRCLLDNGVEFSRKLNLSTILRTTLFKVLSLWGNSYSVKFLVIAPVAELASRRPEEPRNKIEANHMIYTEVACCANYTTVASGRSTTNIVLKAILDIS